jgi:UDP-glucose 4-epimerase
MKQIEAVDQNYEEALQIIIHGAINSRKAAINNNFKAGIFISSDKSRCATTIYGSMKFVAGECFIVDANRETTRLSSVIYGNVLNSTGSVIPLIWDSLAKKYPLTLYSESMTRFMINVEDAIDCIEYAVEYSGYNIVPNLKSFRIKDLFEIYNEKFGLKWSIGSPRISEKEHEQMISPYETDRVSYNKEKNIYLIHYKEINKNGNLPFLPNKGFDSGDFCVTKAELYKILEKYNYFKP